MRYLFFLICGLLPAASVYANIPLPPIKPGIAEDVVNDKRAMPTISSDDLNPSMASQITITPIAKPDSANKENADSSFQSIINRAVSDTIDKYGLATPTTTTITPPPMPDFRVNNISALANAAAGQYYNGIPVPIKKPFKVIAHSRGGSNSATGLASSHNQESVVIPYRGHGEDERTAGRRPNAPTLSQTERVYAQRVGRLKETDAESPFKKASFQKAKRSSLTDPVILFFQERSPELEVGQMGILREDILTPLKRTNTKKVNIYAYAEKEKTTPDSDRRLALSRALMIREYLIDNRISAERIEVHPMGSNTPIAPKDRVEIVLSR